MATAEVSRTRKLTGAAALVAAFAMPFEGLRQVAYRDPPGILTVCWGSTTNVQTDKVYALAECRARLDADMLAAVIRVDSCAPGLPQNVLIAFADAVYNIGPTIACDTGRSTAARLLRSADPVKACAELPKWNNARIAGVLAPLPGLTKRRAAERALCESPA